MPKSILFVFLITIFTFSCEKDEPKPEEHVHQANKLEIQVYPSFGSESLHFDSTYVTAENYLIQFTDVKFYVGNIKNGSTVFASAGLFDYLTTGTKLLTVENDFSKFNSLEMNLGIDSVTNHSDPSAFASDSPLNILNAGDMFWGWNPGYIFIKVDAKVDTIPDGTANLDHFITYHVGSDENLIPLSFANITWYASNEYLQTAKMRLDLLEFLSGPNSLHLKTDFKTHNEPGNEILSAKVIQNFAAALSID